MASLNTILSWFKKGLKPTEDQFAQSWSSFRHKDDKVPMAEVDGLQNVLNNKADATAIPPPTDLSPYAKTEDVNTALSSAKTYADTGDATTLTAAKSYTDDRFAAQYVLETITTLKEGGTSTISDNTTDFLVNPPSDTTVLSYTIQLPVNKNDGDMVKITFGQDGTDLGRLIVNQLTIDGNGRQVRNTIPPSVIRIGDTLNYRLINGQWREF